MKRNLYPKIWLIVAALTLIIAGNPVEAAKTLTYKFKKGDKFTYKMDQAIDMKMNVVGQDVNMKMNQKIEMKQTVLGVDSDGVAELSMKISRIVMDMQGPPGTSMKFDSASKKKPEGPLAEIGPLFKALQEVEFKARFAANGKYNDVQIPKDFFKKLGGTQAGALMQGFFNEDSFKQMVSQGATIFPPSVDKGDTWTNTFDQANPLGKQVVETTYTYAGEETDSGKVLDRIDLVLKMNFGKIENPALAGAEIKVKKQDSKGSMFFDNVRGQMARTVIDQNMEMEITVGDNAITQLMKIKLNMTVTEDK